MTIDIDIHIHIIIFIIFYFILLYIRWQVNKTTQNKPNQTKKNIRTAELMLLLVLFVFLVLAGADVIVVDPRLVLSPPSPTSPETGVEWEAALASQPGFTMVLATAPSCPFSRAVLPVFLGAVQHLHAAGLQFGHTDISFVSLDWLDSHKIYSTPAIFLLSKGRFISRLGNKTPSLSAIVDFAFDHTGIRADPPIEKDVVPFAYGRVTPSWGWLVAGILAFSTVFLRKIWPGRRQQNNLRI